MKRNVSIFVVAVVAIFGVSLFAAEAKKVIGLNPVQDMVRSADSERAIKRLDSQVSAALLKVGKFTVAKKEGGEELKNVDYLLDLSLVEYSEATMNVKKMMQKDAKYAVEIKLIKTSNNHILIQDTIKGVYSSEKVPMNAAVPDVYSAAMESVGAKISDAIVAELFPISVLRVSEGGIVTIPNFGFSLGEVFNVYRVEAMVDPNTGEEVASENVLVCAVVILEVSGSTARAMIPSTVKAYKKYAKEMVEAGMICKRSDDKPIDEKTLTGLIKKMQKTK